MIEMERAGMCISSSWVEGQKNRFTFSDIHNTALEKIFESQQYPNKNMKVRLAEYIGCSDVQVQNWFSRRRTRAALELQEKKEKRTMLEKLDKKSAQISTAGSDLHTNRPHSPSPSPSPSPAPGSGDEKDSVEAILGDSLFAKLTGGVAKPEQKDSRMSIDSKTGSLRIAGPLKSSEIGLMISKITRGNSFVKSEDVEKAVELMQAAGDYAGRKYIMNALLFTKSQPALKTFMRSDGLGVFRSWMLEARKDADATDNKDLLSKAIAILKMLPFDVESIKRHKLGRVVKLLANDKDIDRDISHQAFEVMEKWRELIEASPVPLGNNPDGKTDGVNKGRKHERDDDRQDLHQTASVPLPKFIKGKPSVPLTVKKSNIAENAGFFKELKGGSTASTPSTLTSITTQANGATPESPLAPSPTSTVFKTPAEIGSSSPLSQQNGSPTSTVSSGKSARPESVKEVVQEPAQSSETSGPISTAGPMEWSSSDIASTPVTSEPATNIVDTATTKAATMTPLKTKKVVRFKAERELVEVFEIESRWDLLEWEQEALHANTELNNTNAAMDYTFHHDGNNNDNGNTAAMAFGSDRPQFMMSAQKITALIQGEMWRPPILLQLENHAQRGLQSTENAVQEKRELETLSVTYRQEAYIPPSPAEPDFDLEQGGQGVQLGQAPSSNAAAVMAALTAVAAAAANPSQAATQQNTSSSSAALLNSLAAAGYGGFGAAQPQPISQYSTASTNPYASMYGSFGTGYGQQPSQYQPPYQQQPQTPAPAAATAESMQAAERARALLEMLQQTTTQQQQQQQQQQAYYALYQQGIQSQQSQQPPQQQPQQQQAAFDYAAFYQNFQPRS
ncbi:hypothetical protein BGZ99_005230 [Dissophora globulifera]|uniref:Homeobox domain-containing protein n=1 Tax=Dissophora globulifera TaxID=979702 RepID=A0A9P6UU25_9FUNG|nr:hypothetical protein BGZ99_005230 [Dissophora globulifera]